MSHLGFRVLLPLPPLPSSGRRGAGPHCSKWCPKRYALLFTDTLMPGGIASSSQSLCPVIAYSPGQLWEPWSAGPGSWAGGEAALPCVPPGACDSLDHPHPQRPWTSQAARPCTTSSLRTMGSWASARATSSR